MGCLGNRRALAQTHEHTHVHARIKCPGRVSKNAVGSWSVLRFCRGAAVPVEIDCTWNRCFLSVIDARSLCIFIFSFTGPASLLSADAVCSPLAPELRARLPPPSAPDDAADTMYAEAPFLSPRDGLDCSQGTVAPGVIASGVNAFVAELDLRSSLHGSGCADPPSLYLTVSALACRVCALPVSFPAQPDVGSRQRHGAGEPARRSSCPDAST